MSPLPRHPGPLTGVAAVALLVVAAGGVIGVHGLGARGGAGAFGAASPPARWAAAAAYDAERGQTVLFGGAGRGGPLGDTWTWDGSTWTQRHPAHSPTARQGAAMAYDAVRHEVVLVGGTGVGAATPANAVCFGVSSSGSASASSGGSVSATPVAVPAPSCVDVCNGGASKVFGGGGGSAGSAGSATSVGPPASTNGSSTGGSGHGSVTGPPMVLPPPCVQSVTALNDTWTWDGRDWTERHPRSAPPGSGTPLLAWDGHAGRVVLVRAGGGPVPLMAPQAPVGGTPAVAPVPSAAAAEWDGAQWSAVPGVEAAAWGGSAVLADDPATGGALLVVHPGWGGCGVIAPGTGAMAPDIACPMVGGGTAAPASGSAGSTTAVPPATPAAGAAGDTPCYDPSSPAHGCLMVPAPTPGATGATTGAAGSAPGAPPCDTRGLTCSTPAPIVPPACPRTAVCTSPSPGAPTACTPAGSCPPAPVVQTLALQRTGWVQVSTGGPVPSPPVAMAADPADHGALLVDAAGETWTWNGHAWTLRFSPAWKLAGGTAFFGARTGPALAQDARGHVVLVGGLTAGGPAGDTWTWDGSHWTRQAGTAPAPAPRPSAVPRPSVTLLPAPAPSLPAPLPCRAVGAPDPPASLLPWMKPACEVAPAPASPPATRTPAPASPPATRTPAPASRGTMAP